MDMTGDAVMQLAIENARLAARVEALQDQVAWLREQIAGAVFPSAGGTNGSVSKFATLAAGALANAEADEEPRPGVDTPAPQPEVVWFKQAAAPAPEPQQLELPLED